MGYSQLKAALVAATATEGSGLDFQMWGTVVDRDGIVCAVAFTGGNRGSQWPGSRVISAQKANTANSFSLPTDSSLSTANLYSAVQPGGSLFGLQESNPVDTDVAYKGPSSDFGTSKDPMVGRKIGGVNVFGGGLGLYKNGKIVGAVGVSGDTSCADHNIGWRTRNNLGFDQMVGVGGVSGDANRPDNIIFDIAPIPTAGPASAPVASAIPRASIQVARRPCRLWSTKADTLARRHSRPDHLTTRACVARVVVACSRRACRTASLACFNCWAPGAIAAPAARRARAPRESASGPAW